MVQIIGLTGGIACGKSTVSACLQAEPGVVVVDADEISRNAMKTGTSLQKRVAKAFSQYEGVVNTDGSLNRERLGDLIFNDRALKTKLTNMTRAPILTGMATAILKAVWLSGADVVVLDVPLLFETKVFAWLSEQTVVVHLPESEQIRRLRARDGFTEEQARSRLANQMPAAAKLRLATHVLENTGPKEGVAPRVAELLSKVRRHKKAVTPARVLAVAVIVGFAAVAKALSLVAAFFR